MAPFRYTYLSILRRRTSAIGNNLSETSLPVDDPALSILQWNAKPQSFIASDTLYQFGGPGRLTIGLIAAASCTTVVLSVFLAFLLCKRRRLSLSSALKWCRHRPRPRVIMPMPTKPKFIDDCSWGTEPTRIVYVESAHDDRDIPESPVLRNVYPAADMDTRTAAPSTEKPLEEMDITSGFTLALGLENHTAPVTNTLQASSSIVGVSIFQSLQDDIDNLARGATLRTRSRQGSDASDSSQATINSSVTECFSPAASPSTSSMTTLASTDDELYDEVNYEVRHAQTQSIEFKRGVLLSWQSSGTLSDSLSSELLPTVVVWEPSSTIITNDSENSHTPVSSPTTSSSTRTRLSDCQTIPSLPSTILRDNSSGTVNSIIMSTASELTEESSCTNCEGFLHPPIPYLMVTRPSNASIYTLGSATSSVSIDLDDFPSPPLPAKAIYSKFLDRLHTRKKLQDTCLVDATAVQKRSTVDQFIMMYAAT